MSTPVVLIHGLGSSFKLGWHRYGWVDLLQDEGRDVIPFDLPGHGTRAGDNAPQDFANVENYLLNKIAATGPVDIIGFSAGARVALQFSIKNHSSVRRLVLIGAADSFLKRYDPAPLIAALNSPPPGPDGRFGVLYRLARSDGNSVEAISAFLAQRNTSLDRADLARLNVPTLFVTGERDLLGDAAEMRSIMPDTSHCVAAECDHFSLTSNPKVIEAALDFVAR